jgi:uncharacterized membrane protein YcaP (DUF421 family)
MDTTLAHHLALIPSWPELWRDLIVPDVSLLEKILRPLLVYSFLVIALRLAGKRELAQLNPFDLVVLLTLSNTVQNAIIGPDNSVLGGVIGAATLLILNYFVVRFLFENPRLDQLVEGKQTILIEGGQLLENNLREEVITHAELETAAHKQGFASLSQVERAILEPGGTLSFFGKKPAPEEARHHELLQKLDALSREVVALRR